MQIKAMGRVKVHATRVSWHVQQKPGVCNILCWNASALVYLCGVGNSHQEVDQCMCAESADVAA